jgi:hypothetical protein
MRPGLSYPAPTSDMVELAPRRLSLTRRSQTHGVGV